MSEKDHTERRYTEKEVSETVEKVISEMLERGEIADTRAIPHRPAGNADVIRLLTKIADLADDEDAGEPLDDAIRWANEALVILSEPQAVGRPCSHNWSEPFDGAVKCTRCGTPWKGRQDR